MGAGEPVGSAMQERMQREALWLFREELYHLGFERRRDVLAELLDALLVAGRVPAFVHLSLAPAVSPKVGQCLRRARRRAAERARAAGTRQPLSPGRWRAGVRPGYQRLAAVRCRVQPRARLLSLVQPPIRRAADRGWLGVRLAGPAEVHPRELDRPIG